MKNIAVFVSGGGTNLQALIDEVHGKSAWIALVVSNRSKVYGLERANQAGIETMFVSAKEYPNPEQYDAILLEELKKRKVEWIVLAGYLKIVSSILIQAYANHIINIHPSLIPSFCGPGFYGEKVHQAVFDQGVKVTGATTHLVCEQVDAGPILMQKCVAIEEMDDVHQIAQKVLKIEHEILVKTVVACVQGEFVVKNQRVFIKGKE